MQSGTPATPSAAPVIAPVQSPPTITVTNTPGGLPIVTVGDAAAQGATSTNPAAVYRAYRAQRTELRNQLEVLEETRENLVEQLTPAGDGELARAPLDAAARKGIEERIVQVDQRITAVDEQLQAANLAVARAAAIPGATAEPPRPPRTGPPEEAWVLGGMFMFIVLLPLTIAYARRIWRRGAAVTTLPRELSDRLTTLEQAMDAVAIEVERVGESQRYMTSVLAQGDGARLLGEGAAQEIPVHQKESVPTHRR
ncbi:MAG TPA: hypothetical protein VFG84_01455 [Gemmatimonadaceae bacterium]|nr:hypothetical protein [Gemmatimonadaceae bacterium]